MLVVGCDFEALVSNSKCLLQDDDRSVSVKMLAARCDFEALVSKCLLQNDDCEVSVSE